MRDLDAIAVPYAAKVIRELFMNSAEAGSMGMSTVPLSELYAGACAISWRNMDSAVHLNTQRRVGGVGRRDIAVDMATRDGDPSRREFLVLALPFEATAKLLPQMPPAEGAEDLGRKIERHEHWPICSVHLWFDREITELDHAVLLDREIHWMYNKSRLQPWRKLKGSYLEAGGERVARLCGAARATRRLSWRVRELAEFFPGVREAKLVKAALVKEVRATFGVPPGIDSARPHAASPWPNVSWPATGPQQVALDDGERGAIGTSGGGGSCARAAVGD